MICPLFVILSVYKKTLALNSRVCAACLQTAVVLNPRYPEVSPLFSLSLSWKGERTGQTDDNLRVRLLSAIRAL